MTGWLQRRALRTIHEFRARLARYKLQERRIARVGLAAATQDTAARWGPTTPVFRAVSS